ncbi:MAG: nucleoside/nucleotide kinase family protein, partial [Terrimesophilobacter sp.]
QTTVQVDANVSTLVARLSAHVQDERRYLLGICGAPGSGKSTLSAQLVAHLGVTSVVVPMDGFHIASTALSSPEQLTRRGAIDTFDVDGYLTLLQRLRRRTESVVYAPGFDRSIGEPVAGLIPIPPTTSIVITEGNYLLSHEPGWRDIRNLLDETWFLELDDAVRISRLEARHREFGKSASAATAMAHGSDEDNARRVATASDRADLIIRFSETSESTA